MLIVRIVLSVVFLALSKIPGLNNIFSTVLFYFSFLIVCYDIYIEAIKDILKKHVFDECFLMCIASFGALIIGETTEGVIVLILYQLGECFQDYAVEKSRKNIFELMDIRPDHANLLKSDGSFETVSPDKVKVGEKVIVLPGEKIALDGKITEGETTVDTVSLTGESVPAKAKVGENVLSGCINLTGVITVKVEKNFENSSASKILELVENAGVNKSRSEKLISRFAKIYTPAVCLAALLISFISPLFIRFVVSSEVSFSEWIYRGLNFLVISCPCALVISIPLTFFACIGGSSTQGILIKGSRFIETLSKVRCVVFDKTGTLTKGVFEVSGVYGNKTEKEKILEIASHAECFSSHPISKSIIKAYGKDLDKSLVSNVKEVSGRGISCVYDGKNVFVGNAMLMKENNVQFSVCDQNGTIVHVAVDNAYLGYILISDVIKENSEKAIKSLKLSGVKQTVMLTGDRKKIGEEIAGKLGIDKVYCELLPQDKVGKIEELIKNHAENEKVAFVGDGINDAPVLTRSDVGLSMGALGSDAAIEASDVVLTDDDPLKISKAIRISKKCMNIVNQNIYFAISVKILFLILSAAGLGNMWLAILSDVGVMMIAVLNAMRALNVKRI